MWERNVFIEHQNQLSFAANLEILYSYICVCSKKPEKWAKRAIVYHLGSPCSSCLIQLSIYPFIRLSVCLSACLSVCLSFCLSIYYLPTYLPICVCLSFSLSFRVLVYLFWSAHSPPSVRPSICPSISLSIRPSVRPFVRPSVFLSVYIATLLLSCNIHETEIFPKWLVMSIIINGTYPLLPNLTRITNCDSGDTSPISRLTTAWYLDRDFRSSGGLFTVNSVARSFFKSSKLSYTVAYLMYGVRTPRVKSWTSIDPTIDQNVRTGWQMKGKTTWIYTNIITFQFE